jgi:3-hydroxyisobutyrate dehydrogenase
MNTPDNTPRIAFLGLGAMGQRMVRRLHAAGHTLTVWNRSAEAALSLQQALPTLKVAATPREAAAGADVVISMVYDDTASRAVWLDAADGALAAMAPGALAIESSTLSPAWMGELARAAAARGAALVDAPVAGSRPQAEAGQLIFMAGGEPADVARARPVLAALGSQLHHVGPVGSGAWLKLAVNTLFGAQVVAVAEQLALLRGAGLDTTQALAALKTMPVLSAAAGGAAGLMLAQDWRPQAPVDLIAKDIGYAVAASAQPMPVASATLAQLQTARAAGYGGENLVAVAKLYA